MYLTEIWQNELSSSITEINKNNPGMLLGSLKKRRDKRQRFMPALEGRWDHTLFGSLQTPGLWVQLVSPAPLEEAGMGFYEQEGALVWGQEVAELGLVELRL